MGELTLKFLKKHVLKTDAKWIYQSKDNPEIYKWFPNQFCQKVELLEKEIITIEIDVLKDVELNNQNIEIISDLLFTSTTSALIYNQGKLSLHCHMTIDKSGDYWEPLLLGEAALLQVAEATFSLSKIASIMGAKEICQEHPQSGPRLLLDKNIENRISFSVITGNERSRWEDKELENLVKAGMVKKPGRLRLYSPQNISIEFPFGKSSSLCTITSNTHHPRIGNGLTILQRFPLPKMNLKEGVNLCLSLNKKDSEQLSQSYGFGSFCYKKEMINHILFIPNVAHTPTLLEGLYNSCVQRAKQMSQELTGHTW